MKLLRIVVSGCVLAALVTCLPVEGAGELPTRVPGPEPDRPTTWEDLARTEGHDLAGMTRFWFPGPKNFVSNFLRGLADFFEQLGGQRTNGTSATAAATARSTAATTGGSTAATTGGSTAATTGGSTTATTGGSTPAGRAFRPVTPSRPPRPPRPQRRETFAPTLGHDSSAAVVGSSRPRDETQGK